MGRGDGIVGGVAGELRPKGYAAFDDCLRPELWRRLVRYLLGAR